MAKSNADIAIEQRAKFEFYLLSLNFAILGLSIQTSSFGRYTAADVFELGGWFALFIAGVVGLLRGEWIPVFYDAAAKRNSAEARIDRLSAALQQGINTPVAFSEGGQERVLNGQAAIDKLAATVAEIEKQQTEIEAKIRFRYGVMKWAFMVGIGLLFVARAFPPGAELAELIFWQLS